MNKTQQLLKERAELFDRKFKIMEQIGPEEVDGIFALEIDREKEISYTPNPNRHFRIPSRAN